MIREKDFLGKIRMKVRMDLFIRNNTVQKFVTIKGNVIGTFLGCYIVVIPLTSCGNCMTN